MALFNSAFQEHSSQHDQQSDSQLELIPERKSPFHDDVFDLLSYVLNGGFPSTFGLQVKRFVFLSVTVAIRIEKELAIMNDQLSRSD